MTAIDDIKARIDLVDLVSETVKLRRSGKNYTGFCPFHSNTRTPAFVVFPESGTWRCFGQCNEGGDLFRFVMKKEGWDFSQTLKYLAQRAGVTLEAPTPEKQAEDAQNERLRALLEEAVTFYRHHLLQTPAGQEALDFLKRRGLKLETIQNFGLGYAPDSWEATLRYFTEKGFSNQDLLAVGLVTERQGASGVYDRFRHRLIFPIRDGMGRMTGFGARILNPQDVPKFLNSPQTSLFDKGRLLYGLDLARKAIRAQDQVVIVEGYLDVIILHQEGFTNTVSPMGTALTEDQLRQLKRFSRRVVLALDADAAGEKATLRGLEVARQAMDRSAEVTFDARGLLRQEARLDADLRVTTLPAGMDPDEVVLRNPVEWKSILEAAQPVVIHVMQTLAASRNLEDPKVKSEVAAQVLPLIEDVPNSIERDAYRQRLARLLRVDERSLVGSLPAGRPSRPARRLPARSRPGTSAPLVAANPARRARDLETHILRLLIRQPEAIYLLDRTLLQAGLSRFGPQDFEQSSHQMLLRLLQQALEQDQIDDSHFILQNLPESLEELVQELRTPMPFREPTQDQLKEDLARSVFILRQVRVNESIEQLHSLQQDLEEQGDVGLRPYHDLIVQYTQTLARINQALSHPVQLD